MQGLYKHTGMCSLSGVRLFVTLWTVPSRLLCPWDSPGKNTGVDCHFLLQGIFPTQGSLVSLAFAGGFFTTEPPRKPCMSARHVISPVARFQPTARLLGLPLGFLSSCGHPLWVWGFLHSVLRLCDFVPVQNIIYYSSIIAHTSDTNILFQGPGYMDAGYQLPVT